MTALDLRPPLTLAPKLFEPFGDVVVFDPATATTINSGFARRMDAIAGIDVASMDGRAALSIFEAKARRLPLRVEMMERHPLGSQLFFPMQERDWLVVVCTDPSDAGSYAVFRAAGWQGVNYRPGVWHHPLLALDDGARFLVVDRAGGGGNLEEADVSGLGLTIGDRSQ